VYYTNDGTNFVINTTANSTLSGLGNVVVLSYANIIIGNSSVYNYINSTSWSGIVTKKNYIVNGGMQVSQENGTTTGTGGGAGVYYPVDQFFVAVGGTTTAVISSSQVESRTPGGSPYRLRATVTTADTVVDSGDVCTIRQYIEGYRVADLKFGTSSAKTMTLQFGIRAPAGTYSIGIWNGGATRVFIAEYVISAAEANTDIVKSVTIPGDQIGTWAADNTAGFMLFWSLMAGSNSQGTVGSWNSVVSNSLASPNQTNFAATNGNVFELFDVGLYEGSVAPPFSLRYYSEDLHDCMRYFQVSNPTNPKGIGIGMISMSTLSTTFGVGNWTFPVPMRTTPLYTYWNNGTQNAARITATGVQIALTSASPIGGGCRYGIGGIVQSGTTFTVGSGVDYDMQFNARL
jgi:hypothetical protein